MTKALTIAPKTNPAKEDSIQHEDDDVSSSDPEFADFDDENGPYGPMDNEPEEDIDFWGVNINAGATHEESLELGQSITLRHAALPTLSGKSADGTTTLSVTVQGEQYALCTLSKSCPQYALKLVFSDVESPIKFTNTGSSAISLIGYQSSIVFGDDMDFSGDEGDEMIEAEDEDEEVSSEEEAKAKPVTVQAKTQQQNNQQKKPKQPEQAKPQENKQNGQQATEKKPQPEKKPENGGASPQEKKKKKKNKGKKQGTPNTPATPPTQNQTPAKGKEETNTSNSNKVDQSKDINTPGNGKRPNEGANTPVNKKAKIN